MAWFFLGLVACSGWDPVFDGDDTAAAVARIESAAPVGGPVLAARSWLEDDQGFECLDMVHSGWKGRPPSDFLWCDRRQGAMVARRWQIAIWTDGNGAITEIDAATGLIGP